MNTKLLMTASALLAVCPALHAQTAPVPPAAAASAPVTLRYKFVPGQVRRYAYTMNMDMHMLTGQSGAAVPMNMTMNMVMRQRVKSVRAADGAATLVTVLEGMHMLQNGKEVALPAAAKAKMTKPTTLVMLPNGKMLSMDAPGMSGLSAPGMDFGKSMFNGTGFLPDGPVKSGDTWNGAVDSAMAGVQAAYTATLTGLSAGPSGATLATIENKTTGTMNKSMTEGMPAAMKMAGTITGAGTQVFDTAAGAIQSAAGTTDMDMTMTFGKAAGGQAPPAGMPSAMKMQMQMKFTMTRLSDTGQ